MTQQKSDTILLKVLKISFLAGFILYIPLKIIYLFLWWLEITKWCGNYNILCAYALLLITYFIVPLGWLGTIIFLAKHFKKSGIPKTSAIIWLGSLTFIWFTWYAFMLTSSLIYSEYPEYILVFYPLVYGGYHLLFNRLLPTHHKK